MSHYHLFSCLQVFPANNDRNSIVAHVLTPHIYARYVKIKPRSWFRHISMRFELYGERRREFIQPVLLCDKIHFHYNHIILTPSQNKPFLSGQTVISMYIVSFNFQLKESDRLFHPPNDPDSRPGLLSSLPSVRRSNRRVRLI